MIIRPPTNWFRMLFIWNGSVLQRIVPQLFLMLLVSSLAVLTDGKVFGEKIPLDTAPFPLVGVSLAIFLAFRNNASYERYLEARKIWGNILISSRSLTSQVISYLPNETYHYDRAVFVRRLIAFVYALKHQLRKSNPEEDLAYYLGAEDVKNLTLKSYKPIALLDMLRAMLVKALKYDEEPSSKLWIFDAQINELSHAVGACERISNTPIPYPYGVLVHRTVYAYCFMLPFGLVDTIGAATPLISVFVSYTLFALEAIAQEISEPFGCAPNTLALDAISRNIERSLLEQCGEPLPDELQVGRRYELS